MKEIESILKPIEGFLSSINRNTVEGWYEIEIGIPGSWVFNQNDEINCEIISENETGKLIKIFPKNHNIVIDDLILFVEIIIDTNKKISEKEKEFANKMTEMKKTLEKQASEFYKELDELKDNSFKKINNKFVDVLNHKREIKNRKKQDKINGIAFTGKITNDNKLISTTNTSIVDNVISS